MGGEKADGCPQPLQRFFGPPCLQQGWPALLYSSGQSMKIRHLHRKESVLRDSWASWPKGRPQDPPEIRHLQKNYGFTRLISIFMKRRIQPLQARISTMWEYSGPQDASRLKRHDLSKEALDEAVHNVIKGAKSEQLPSDCPVEPFGETRRLPQVDLSTSSINHAIAFLL